MRPATPSRQQPWPWMVALWLMAGLLVLVGPAATSASAADDGETAADDGEDSSGRLTWGVVPSSPDGPTGRSRFDLRVDPGETLVDHVGVINYTYDPLAVDVYAHDAFTTEAGDFDILPASDTSTDAGTWLSLDVRQVTISPRSRVDIPFRVVVPPNATPGDHAAGIVAALSDTSVDEDGNRITVDRRVGARVYLRVAGELDPQLSVEIVGTHYQHTLNPLGRGTVEFTYQATNTGNVRLAGRPTVETSWLFGWLPTDDEGSELPELLPGETFTATAELSGVAPLVWLRGAVQVEPIPAGAADLDQPVPTATAEAWVWAVPWPLLVLVAVAVAGLAWWRRRPRDTDPGPGEGDEHGAPGPDSGTDVTSPTPAELHDDLSDVVEPPSSVPQS